MRGTHYLYAVSQLGLPSDEGGDVSLCRTPSSHSEALCRRAFAVLGMTNGNVCVTKPMHKQQSMGEELG